MHSRIRIPDWLLLLAFCAFFFLWRLSSFGLIGADEPRYAQIAREMLAHHDWITPTLGGTAWLEKPPLYYWEAMIAYCIFGVSDWAARLPSVIDATLLVLAVYWFFRRFRPGHELDAGLMVATSAAIVGFARAASTDMPLASTFAIAMLTWFAWFESGNRWFLAGFYVLIALAMLAKGPVGPFLAAMVIVLFAALQRNLKVVWSTLCLPEIALFCAVALPWYVLVQLRNPQFFRVFILEHNLARFGSNVFHHPEPFWYYVPITLLSWLPWTVFVVAALVWTIRRLREQGTDSLNAFLLIWIGIVVVFFSISESKLPGYIVPAVPGGALLLANYLRERMQEPDEHRSKLPIAALHGLISGALLFSALVARFTILQHRFVWDSAESVPLLASILFAALVCALFLKFEYAAIRFAAILPAIFALAIALRWAAPALDESLSARSASEALTRLSRPGLPVAAAGVSRETEFGLQFYRNQKLDCYELGQVPAGEHLLVVRGRSLAEVKNEAPGRKLVYLGDFPPQKLEFFYVSQ